MATLIHLGTRGINLDTVAYWYDRDEKLTLYLVRHDDYEVFTGDERVRMLKALTLNSMEY